MSVGLLLHWQGHSMGEGGGRQWPQAKSFAQLPKNLSAKGERRSILTHWNFYLLPPIFCTRYGPVYWAVYSLVATHYFRNTPLSHNTGKLGQFVHEFIEHLFTSIGRRRGRTSASFQTEERKKKKNPYHMAREEASNYILFTRSFIHPSSPPPPSSLVIFNKTKLSSRPKMMVSQNKRRGDVLCSRAHRCPNVG